MDQLFRTHDQVGRPFAWAEPLICDQMIQAYGEDRRKRELDRVIAIHTTMWMALIDGNPQGFYERRHELARLARDASLPIDAIERADRAVLLELILVVVTRFRNSDRLRIGYVERLHAALRVIKANYAYTLH